MFLVAVVGVRSLFVSVAVSRIIADVSGIELASVKVAVASVVVDSLLVSDAGSRLLVVVGH